MKKHFEFIVLCMVLLFAGCSSALKENEFIGVWLNAKENCKIQLNKDFTFSSTNVPLDVANKYYITFNKETNIWQGTWSLEDKQLKLTINDSYYYLDVNTSLTSSKPRLYVKLLDESGGEMIYFDRQ
ncbi:MAG: hypothetical protein IPM95_00185 [Sphingobacteriales bacterium]|nr:hypothetical protein [Sphingobacteriales bacterium]